MYILGLHKSGIYMYTLGLHKSGIYLYTLGLHKSGIYMYTLGLPIADIVVIKLRQTTYCVYFLLFNISLSNQQTS